MSFTLYLVGFLILIGGLAYGASMMGIAPHWIGVGVIILFGLAILTGATRTRQRDKAE